MTDDEADAILMRAYLSLFGDPTMTHHADGTTTVAWDAETEDLTLDDIAEIFAAFNEALWMREMESR